MPTAVQAHLPGSECVLANVPSMVLDIFTGVPSYRTTVFLYRGTTLTFTELDGFMTPSVFDGHTLLALPGAGTYIYTVPMDGRYTLRVEPSLGRTKFSLRCDESPLSDSCLLAMAYGPIPIPDRYIIDGTFYAGENIYIETSLPFKLMVNGDPSATPLEVNFVNFRFATDGNYRLVVSTTSRGGNNLNIMVCGR